MTCLMRLPMSRSLNDWYWYMVIFFYRITWHNYLKNRSRWIARQRTFPIFSSSLVLSARIWCNRWAKFNSQADGFSSLRLKRAMTDYDDRSNCASNMYLPYYVPDFSSVSSFLPQTTSCQVNFPYSSNIAQVQPVREVTFRDYGLDHPSKWHYRGNYASYYSTEEIMHRDLLQSTNRAEIIFKNDSVYSHHGGTNSSCNFFTNVGRNGVLPQGFDQFFETANSEKPNPEQSDQKPDTSVPGDAACNVSTDSAEQTKQDPTETMEEESSISTCDEEKNNGSSRFTRLTAVQSITLSVSFYAPLYKHAKVFI